jgi:hypothetical protein
MPLQPNTTYYYRVKSVNTDGESDYSNVVAVTTLSDNNPNIYTPSAASNPIIRYLNPLATGIDIVLEQPATNEYIQEYKITVSVNSDYSSPVYTSLTYKVSNTTTYFDPITKANFVLFTVPGLSANTLYYVRIKASNTTSLSGNTDSSIRTLPAITAPEAVGTTLLTAITATANWNLVTGADRYFLDVATDIAFSSLIISNLNVGNVNHYDIPVLSALTTYFYRVRSGDGTNTSINSNIIEFTTLHDTLTYNPLYFDLLPPTFNVISNIYTTKADVSWKPVIGATSYSLDIATNSSFTSPTTSTTSKTAVSIGSLTANTLYYIRVKAVSSFSTSAYSTTQTINTLLVDNTLNPPLALTPTVNLSNLFILNWVKRSYANRYYIELSTNSGFSSILNSYFTGDIDTFVIDGLSSATTYYARIYALNALNSSTASNSITVTTASALPAITVGTTTEITDTTFRINWTLDATYATYKISIWNKNTGVYIGNGFYYQRTVGAINNLLIDVFLDPSVTYSFQILGITSAGDIQYSTTTDVTTKYLAPIVSVSTDGTTIQWKGDANRLQVSTDVEFKALKQGYAPYSLSATQIASKTCNLAKIIESENNYYIRTYYYDGTQNGQYSNVLATKQTTPLLLAPIVTNTTALIRWKKGNSNNYRIQVKSGGTPISGHTFPVSVGDTDNFLVVSLTPDVDYTVQIQQFDNTLNKFTLLSLPVTFHTNKYAIYTDLTQNGGLTVPTISFSNIAFDRFTINLTGGYSKYILQISKRSDFIGYVTQHLEIASPYEFLASPNTTYYINAYGVTSTPDRTSVGTGNQGTSALTAYSSSVSGTSTLSFSTLNVNESILTWTTLTNATGYEIEVSQSNTFNLLDTSVEITYLDINKALISNLSGALTYYARVYGYSANSISGYSNIITL